MTKNVMIVGVGGQGSLLASKLLGHLLLKEGYDVKVSEVHGMSQRGGSTLPLPLVERANIPAAPPKRAIITSYSVGDVRANNSD